MDQIGKIVVLAGRNGSGKTRFLNRLNDLHNSRIPVPEDMEYGSLLKKWDHGNWKGATNGIASRILALELESGRDKLQPKQQLKVANLSLNSLVSKDPATAEPRNLLNSTHTLEGGLDQLAAYCWLYIQHLQNQMREATHERTSVELNARKDAEKRWDELYHLIEILLGVTPDRDIMSRFTLFGRPINDACMSNGQKSLLQFAVGMHAQATAIEDGIVLMDEPENHLHAAALVEVVTRVANLLTGGQLWIATHSVPLIAALSERFADDLSLFCMEDGSISYAGRTPERVLSSLMGGEENVCALRSFVSLPDTLARVNFASQCLQPSSVVGDATDADPQVGIIRQALDGVRPDDRPLRVLEFGAVKGRILSSLAAALGDDLATHVDYVAWDCSDTNRVACEATIVRAYGDATGWWFTDRSSLFSDHDSGEFDVVVMCNVLHEIDPIKWPAELGTGGIVSQARRSDGRLLVVEDYMMPQGEHSHRYGFVVLIAEQLKALFATSNEEGFLSVDVSGRYAGRIRSHLIPAVSLARVSTETRKAALKLVQTEAETAIHRLRSAGDISYRKGLEHAFWTQQYANSGLALKEL